MAQDFTAKRRALAEKVVDHATALLAAIAGFRDAAAKVQAAGGGFEDADFEGQDRLSHVTAWQLNTLLTQISPALTEVGTQPIPGDGGTTIGDVLYAVARAS